MTIHGAFLPSSNFQNAERDLYSDYSEISPWNPTYLNRFKRVSKPSWRFFSGTMPDQHQLVRGHDILLAFFSFWRSLGMWLGISNPFLGLCVFIGLTLGGWPYCTIYVSWSVIWVGLWAWYLGVPIELIFNGLYPSQGVLLGFLVYTSNTDDASTQQNQIIQLALLVPLALLTLILFQAIGSFFVKLLRVTPMFLAPALVGFLFRAVKTQSTYLFNSPENVFVKPAGVSADHQSFLVLNNDDDNVSLIRFATDFYEGMAYILFNTRWEALIPLSIGLLITSPISCLMAWFGALMGACSAILISPLWGTVATKFLIYPSAITMMSLAGLYYVVSIHSVIIGICGCFFTTFISIGLSSLFEVFDQPTSAPLAAYMVVMMFLISGGAFSILIPVELSSVTTPEDHIRRFLLSRKIITDMKISREYGRIDPSLFRNIETSLLPILLCAYSKHGFIDNVKSLLNLGADPNASDYDGRCALHIACAENQEDIVHLLLSKQADLHKSDNFDNNALSSALLNGHYTLAKYLFKKGGRLQISRDHVSSMLCYMVAYNDLERLKIWLECGADPNCTDYDDRTPLHIANAKKNDEMIKFLKRYAPKKGKEDRWGNKPEQCYGQTVADLSPVKDTKKRLSRRRNRQDNPGMHHIMTIDPAILEAVIRQILRSDDKDKSVALLPSLICELVYIKEHRLLQELIKENVINNLNISDYDLRTPLHIACAIGDLDAVKILCWNNAELNAIDRFSNSPLLQACKNKHDDICEFLLEQGADLCLPHEMQVSELCWAVFNNDFDMIQRLVKCGINIHAGDYDSRTCLAVAFDNKNKRMMELLRQYITYSSASSFSSTRRPSGSGTTSSSSSQSPDPGDKPEETALNVDV